MTFAWNMVNQEDRTVCKRDVLAETEPERDGEFVPIPL